MPPNDDTLPLVCRPGKLRFGIFQQVDPIELIHLGVPILPLAKPVSRNLLTGVPVPLSGIPIPNTNCACHTMLEIGPRTPLIH